MTNAIQQIMRENERLWDEHHRDVYLRHDVDAAMAAMAAQVSVVNTPAMTGGADPAGVRRYLAEDVVGHLPADLAWRRVSRTVETRRLVDETVVGFTYDRELPWLLPGAAPTHRPAEVLTFTLVALAQGRIHAVRTLWDHAGLVAQLGLHGWWERRCTSA